MGMKHLSIVIAAITAILPWQAIAQDAPPKTDRERIVEERAKDQRDKNDGSTARAWDKDTSGLRPWDPKYNPQQVERPASEK
jgi:hypothetical protein